jgi:hypothetical protein
VFKSKRLRVRLLSFAIVVLTVASNLLARHGPGSGRLRGGLQPGCTGVWLPGLTYACSQPSIGLFRSVDLARNHKSDKDEK